MFLRFCAFAVATLALAGCASNDYGGYYDDYGYYPGGAYGGPYYDYYDSPYYGGFGHSHFYGFDDDDDDRYFSPARGLTCDRVRDVCYDRHGLNYPATMSYLGERSANRSYKKFGDDVFVFSPRSGVTCDRRTKTCSSSRWTERVFDDQPSRAARIEPRTSNQRPRLRDDDDDGATQRLLPALRERQQRLVGNDDADRFDRPSTRDRSDEPRQLLILPRQPKREKPGNR
ncbi:YcgJ family protein [Dongia deserti]|uniref:YcgJ family protein n=1 Tax=Dongia deserti TaxID=2268030 RepID=UPI000E651153|nr:YcgJ family protein [Dongia deserti]